MAVDVNVLIGVGSEIVVVQRYTNLKGKKAKNWRVITGAAIFFI